MMRLNASTSTAAARKTAAPVAAIRRVVAVRPAVVVRGANDGIGARDEVKELIGSAGPEARRKEQEIAKVQEGAQSRSEEKQTGGPEMEPVAEPGKEKIVANSGGDPVLPTLKRDVNAEGSA